ncbi:MAG: TetR/AcrR family transcriptional regulator [Bacillota bacterium]
MPRKDRVADARRTQVKQAAVEAVIETGYGELSVKEIARRAGVSTGVLYHYFRNKDDLLVQALGAAFSETDRRLRAEVDQGTPGAERLGTYLRLSATLGASGSPAVPVVLNSIGQIDYSPLIRERLGRLFRSFRSYAATVLNEAAHGQNLSRERSEALAALIVAVGLGMAVQWAAEPGALSPEACGEELERLFRTVVDDEEGGGTDV